MEDASHYTKQIEEKNQLPSQVTDSLNKLTLNKNSQQQQHKSQYPPRQQNFQRGNTQKHTSSKGCYRCGATGHYDDVFRRSKNQTCHKCRKIGHITNMCKTKNPSSSSSKPQHQQRKSNNNNYHYKGKQHVINAATHTEHESEKSSDDDVYVFQIGNKSDTHPILINNTKIDVIIDSGSTINILDENSFKLIKPQPTVTKSKTKIYPLQSDSSLQLHGVTSATITENNISLPTKFYIVKGNYGSLL